eukprot:5835299-Prymnesium_polylepis.2
MSTQTKASWGSTCAAPATRSTNRPFQQCERKASASPIAPWFRTPDKSAYLHLASRVAGLITSSTTSDVFMSFRGRMVTSPCSQLTFTPSWWPFLPSLTAGPACSVREVPAAFTIEG